MEYQLTRPTLETAQQLLAIPEPVQFTFFVDLAYAIRQVSSIAVKPANEARLEEILINALNTLERTNIKPFSLTEQIEGLMAQRQDIADIKKLMEEDPTGITAIQESAKRLRGEQNRLQPLQQILPGMVPEFINAGADLAVDMYSSIQPLAAKLVP